MTNYREILRLNNSNYSQHQIAASGYSSHNTIREVLKNAKASGLEWPLDDSTTYEVIMALLYPDRLDLPSTYPRIIGLCVDWMQTVTGTRKKMDSLCPEK